MKTPKKLTYTALSFMFGLTSCASPGVIGQADRDVRAAEQQTARYETIARSPLPASSPSRFHLDKSGYIPGEAKPSDHGYPLPSLGNRAYVDKRPHTLSEIARIISTDTKIPVIIAPDMLNKTGGGGNVASIPPAVDAQNVSEALNSANVSGPAIRPLTPSQDTEDGFVLDNTGPLERTLDIIATHFKCTWFYNGESIVFSQYLTRTYTVHAISSNTTVTNSMTGTGMSQAEQSSGSGSGGGGGGGGGGGQSSGGQNQSSQNVSSTFKTDIWTDLISGVKSIVGDSGGISDQQATGTITVTAAPDIIHRVQDFIERENQSLSNLITVSLQIVNLSVTTSDTVTFNPDIVLKFLGAKYNLGLYAASALSSLGSGSSSGSSGGSSGGISTTNVPSPGVNIIHGDSSALVTALSTMGRTKVLYELSMTTMNGGVAPFSKTITTGYVRNMSVTNTGSSTAGSQTSTSMTTATVVTGLNVALIPRIDERNKTVLLEEAISQSALIGPDSGFKNFKSPDNQEEVQLPIINSDSSIAYLEAPSGETLVLTGYSADSQSATHNGSGAAESMLLGGSKQGTHSHEVTFYLITPVIQHITHKIISTSGM